MLLFSSNQGGFLVIMRGKKGVRRRQKKKKLKLSEKSNLDKDIVKLAFSYFIEHVLLAKEMKNLIDL